MTDDEVKNKQEETLKNLEKYNKDRKTEIIDDPDEKPLMQEWLDEQERLNKERGITVDYETEPEEKLIMSHVCPYCGTMAYMGQIHGIGYCREKVQYEQ